MKIKSIKATRKFTALFSVIMLTEQLASTGAVLYAHAEEESTAYSIEHHITSSWEGGYNAEIALKNLTYTDTKDWSITFSTSDEITNLWGGVITECREVTSSDYMEALVEASFEINEKDEAENEKEDTGSFVVTEEATDVENLEGFNDRTYEEFAGENIDETVPSEEIAETEEDVVPEENEESNEDSEPELEDIDEEPVHYFQYTVEALEHTAVIAAGGQVIIGYSANGDDRRIWDEKAEFVFDTSEMTDSEKESDDLTGGTYVYDGYTVEVTISDQWKGAYNVKLLIQNTGEETIHNWGFVMETEDKISGLYNAVEVADNDGVRLFKNAGYNQDIPAGGSVEVGYTAFYEEKADVPQKFAISHIEKEVELTECEVSLFITDEWEDGGMARLILENKSDQMIEDWTLEFDSELEIKDLWGGIIESHKDGHYVIRNAEYAQNIPAGETWIVEIVFNGASAEIKNVEVKQIVVNGENVVAPTSANSEDIDFETDTDGDGIPDAFEEMIGTDPELEDTDEDGLDDFTEVFVLGSDPLVYDSITSGVSDADADSDGDGISNGEEVRLGTNPNNKDTDYDGLDDDDEIDCYGTDPKKSDTDDDGIKDGDEIKLGLDPVNPATYGTRDGEYAISQIIDSDSEALKQINTASNPYKFSVDITAAGYIEGNLDAAESDYAYAIKNDAMLGMALQLDYDLEDTVEEVTLQFQLNDSSVAGAGNLYPEEPELQGIRRYNVFHYFEDKNMLLPVETFFDEDNNVAYAVTDELGTYCLMDMEKVFARLDSFDKTETINDYEANRTIDEAVLLSASEFVYPSTPIETENGLVMGASIVREGEEATVSEITAVSEEKQVIKLIFILCRKGKDETVFNRQKELIPDLLERLQKENAGYDYKVAVLNPATVWTEAMHNSVVWYDNPETIREMLSEVEYTYDSTYSNYGSAFSGMSTLLSGLVKEDPLGKIYMFGLHSGYVVYENINVSPYTIYRYYANNLVYSEIGKYVFEYTDYEKIVSDEYPSFVEQSGGRRWTCNKDMLDQVYTAIFGDFPKVSGEVGNGEIVPQLPEPSVEDNKEALNLYFVLQTTGPNASLFEKQRNMIYDLMDAFEEENDLYDVHVTVMVNGYSAQLIGDENGNVFFDKSEDLREVLDEKTYLNVAGKRELPGIYGNYMMIDRELPGKNYVFLLHNGNVNYDVDKLTVFCDYYQENINYSEVGDVILNYEDTDPTDEYATIVEKTGGKRWMYDEDTANQVYAHITGHAPKTPIGGEESEPQEPTEKEFFAITLTGWNLIKLDAPLSEGSSTDTDEDGLTDWDEVNTSMLFLNDDHYVLPTLEECILSDSHPYVSEGLSRFCGDVGGISILEKCLQRNVLPILSDPTSEDSDGDEIYDGKSEFAGKRIDIHPLEYDDYPDKFDALIGLNIIDMDTMYQTYDGFTLCMTPLSEIYGGLGYGKHSFFDDNSNDYL